MTTSPKEPVTREVLKQRTKRFGLRVMQLVDALPRTASGRAIASQLIRSGTSVGANYRSACRGRSEAEFVAKLGTVVEEADESAFWMELIVEGKLLEANLVTALLAEAGELVALFTASIQTTRSKRTKPARVGSPKSGFRNPES